MIIKLYIAGVLVLSNDPGDPAAGGAPVITAVELARDYQSPATLTFNLASVFGTSDFDPDDVVQLVVDDELVFEGLIELPSHGAGVAPAQQVNYYRVRDRSAITRYLSDGDDNTSVRLVSGTLADVLDEYYALVATQLAEMGIDGTPLFGTGAATIPVESLTLDNVSVTAGLRAIAEAAPGIRMVLAFNGSDEPAFRFVHIFQSDVHEVVANEKLVDSIRIERSLDGCAGAVRTNSRAASGTTDYTISAALTPAWDTGLEASIVLDAHYNTVDDAGGPTPESLVFRRWSFAGLGITADNALIVEAKVVPNLDVWRPIDAVIDYQAETVTTTFPVLKLLASNKAAHNNPRVPGGAKRGECRLKVSQRSDGYITVPGERYPASGYSGAAYALAPVQMQYVAQVQVPAGVDEAAYAQAAHAVLSQPIVTGGFTMQEDIPAALFLLDRRINVSRSNGTTGLESLSAPLASITMQWRSNDASLSIDFSTDRSALLRRAV